jgi:serine/threonine-protein kinase
MKFLRDSVRGRPELRQRFLREASAASALKHPNAVEILDIFDFAESSPVMVMELLQGETLADKLDRDQRLSMEETAALILPVVSAVGTAHALGIVHRDLKPENLFLLEQPAAARVKVLDFGIAKLTSEYHLARGMSRMQTDAGSLLGTPHYMAPEQASGEVPVDHRADVWSIGVILYECLSGTRPIEGENLTQVVSRLMSAGIIPLERLAPELPPEVTALVAQMLARDPSRRPGGLREVAKVLARHARSSAPEFTEPSTDRGSLLPYPPVASPLSMAKHASSKGVDVQAPTMMSAPPVNSSLITDPPVAPPARRSPLILLGAIALAIAGVWLVLSRGARSPADASERAAQGSVGPASAPGTNAVPPLPTGANASSQVEVPPPSAQSPSKQVRSSASGTTQNLPKPKVSVAPKSEPTAKRGSDDETLFSGRK